MLICYGGLSGLGSWLLFRHGQDLDRFNAVVGKSFSLGGAAKWTTRLGLKNSPGSALLAKELGLQQINLSVVGLLLGLYFLAVGMGYWAPSIHRSAYYAMSRDMGWILMMVLPPLLIGCAAIAEERRLGVILWHSTLPISRSKQWLAKLTVVYGLTFFITCLLSRLMTVSRGMIDSGDRWEAALFSFGLATIGLFISSLCRSLLAAFGTALGVGFALPLGLKWLANANGRWLLQYESWLYDIGGEWMKGWLHLVMLFNAIGLTAVMLALVGRNMRRVLPDRRDGAFSFTVLLSAFVVTTALGTLVFYRTWEWLWPSPEPAAAIRLSGGVRPKVEGRLHSLAVLLPDGRLASPYFTNAFTPSAQASFTFIQTPDAKTPGETLWRDVAVGNILTCGLRQDGTLWSWGNLWSHLEAEKIRFPRQVKPQHNFFQPITQISAETHWASLAAGWEHAFGLKTDGSLWA